MNSVIMNEPNPIKITLNDSETPEEHGGTKLLTRKSLNNLQANKPIRNTKNLSLNLNGISNNLALQGPGTCDTSKTFIKTPISLTNLRSPAIRSFDINHTDTNTTTNTNMNLGFVSNETSDSASSNFLSVSNPNKISTQILSPTLPFRKPGHQNDMSVQSLRNQISQSNLKSRNKQIVNQPIITQQPKLNRRKTMLSLSIPSVKAESSIESAVLPKSSPTSPVNVQSASSERTVLSDESSNYGDDAVAFEDTAGGATNNKFDYTENLNMNFQTQTILQDFSKLTMNDNFDENKLNAYPDGPAMICKGLYLYSEPNLDQISQYDVIINVAKEVKHPFKDGSKFDNSQIYRPLTTNNNVYKRYPLDPRTAEPDYYYVPWTHTSKLCKDFPILTEIISKSVENGGKVLVHCQCGVSRSASLIIAYIMKLMTFNLTEAYSFVKDKANDISPNMTLIFQLMEWGDLIGCGVAKSPGYYDPKYKDKQIGEPNRS